MGFLDIFRKKAPMQEQYENSRVADANYRIIRTVTDDGKLQIDYIDGKPDFRKFYDSTRLVLESAPENINGYMLHTGKVSWYNQTDAIMFDGNDSRHDALTVRMEIDPNLVRTNDEYTKCLMQELLDKNRVLTYQERGLTDNPDRPCGNYVGGVAMGRNGNYTKTYDSFIGTTVHNMPAIRQARAQYQEEQRIKRAKEARRQELYKELDDLNNPDSDARF